MDSRQAADLLERYLKNDCSPDEKQIVEQWYAQLIETGEWQLGEKEKEQLKKLMEHRLFKQIGETITGREAPVRSIHSARSSQSRFWWVAASVLFILLAGTTAYIFLFNITPKHTELAGKRAVTPDLSPGGNKAVLTLSNGTTVMLDTVHSGKLAQEGSVSVLKSTGGEISYAGPNENNSQQYYNVISTPRGGQYQVVLSDGTKVWLNAASSLRFPVQFNEKNRVVELDGEGYFEVARNPNCPFHVKFNQYVDQLAINEKMDVEVLGTHFNVNSYKDEKENKTTLLEGVVKVHKGTTTSLLKPGEQAIAQGSDMYVTKKADMEQVIAWKNNWFEFDDIDLPTVMRQISRWYDVDVVYETKHVNEKLGGRISKNLPLSSVLQLLKNNGVNCHLKGKALILTD